MKRLLPILLITFILSVSPLETAVAQQPDPPVVKAVLFMSPACSHCHYVITELLMGMAEDYGDQLEIVLIDVTQPGGSELYHQAINYYEVPEERRGVPMLVMGDVILVGSGEIPDQFPELVANTLVAGGIEWPEFPGLAEALATTEQATPPPTVTPVAPTPMAAATSLTAGSPTPAQEVVEAENTAVYLAYFYDPACLECAQVSQELAHLQGQYPKGCVSNELKNG